MDNGRLTLNVKDAAWVLGVSKNSCYQAVLKGELPSIRLGKRILIPSQALKAMLESAGKPKEG